MANASAAADDGPGVGAIVGAVAFWVVAIFLGLVTAPVENVTTAVWVLRIGLIVGGIALTIALILRERARTKAGLPLDRDAAPFDLWTIAHTTAGLVMGAWSIPFPLVIIFTVLWEVFEWQVPGFGESEVTSNRVVDIAVAVVGWILVAGVIALSTQTDMPWVLPSIDSLVRNAGIKLF